VIARAGSVVDDLGVVWAYAEEALGRQLGRFQEVVGQLA